MYSPDGGTIKDSRPTFSRINETKQLMYDGIKTIREKCRKTDSDRALLHLIHGTAKCIRFLLEITPESR